MITSNTVTCEQLNMMIKFSISYLWDYTSMQFVKLSNKDIVEMIFFPVVNETCRVLAEGIAVKAADLDIASVMGMGFPPYRFVILSRFSLILLVPHRFLDKLNSY